MNRHLLTSSCLLLVPFLLSCGDPPVDPLTGGRFEASVYMHDGLGLQLAFPAHWTIVESDDRQQLNETGKQVLAGDESGGAYRMGMDRSHTLFTVFRHPLDQVQGINPSLVGGVENVRTVATVQTAVDYLQMMQSFLGRGGIPLVFEPIVPETKLGNATFAVLAVTLRSGTHRFGQIYFCRRMDDYMLTLVATFSTQDEWTQIEAVLQTLTMKSS